MQINEKCLIERIHVVLEKGIDFDDGDLEAEYSNAIGYRKFKRKFVDEYPKTIGFDEVTKIGMCSDDHKFVNATLIRYL